MDLHRPSSPSIPRIMLQAFPPHPLPYPKTSTYIVRGDFRSILDNGWRESMICMGAAILNVVLLSELLSTKMTKCTEHNSHKGTMNDAEGHGDWKVFVIFIYTLRNRWVGQSYKWEQFLFYSKCNFGHPIQKRKPKLPKNVSKICDKITRIHMSDRYWDMWMNIYVRPTQWRFVHISFRGSSI